MCEFEYLFVTFLRFFINYLSEKTKEILKLFYIAKIIPKLSIIFEKLQKITLHYATIFCII